MDHVSGIRIGSTEFSINDPYAQKKLTAGQGIKIENNIVSLLTPIEDVIIIDESIDDPMTRVSGDVNGQYIQQIRNQSHRYLGKYIDTGSGGRKMLLCQLSDANSNYFFDGTTAAALDGTMGDVWMRHPDIYAIAAREGDKVYIHISTKDNGGRLFPNNDLIGVYEAYSETGKLYSWSGRQSTGGYPQTQYVDYAASRGSGFSITKPQHHNLMGTLYCCKYGNTHCQSQCGAGTSSNSKTTGETNTLGMTDTTSANGNSMSINFWGLENWWGNKSEWMQSVVANNGTWTITEDDGIVRTVLAPNSRAWVYSKKLHWGEYLDLIPLPDQTSGSDAAGYCDAFYGSTGTSYVCRSSERASSACGITFLNASGDTSYASPNAASRLAYHGPIEVTTNIAVFKAATPV